MLTSIQSRALAMLKRPAAKRDVGGHGDFAGFLALLEALEYVDIDDLSMVELPQRRTCSTCKFLTPEFIEASPCWDCVLAEDLPKWRPRC